MAEKKRDHDSLHRHSGMSKDHSSERGSGHRENMRGSGSDDMRGRSSEGRPERESSPRKQGRR
jgi:hypothetical protein